MNYINTEKEIEISIKNSINKNIDELLKEIKKKMPNVLKQIQNEIYSVYRTVVENNVVNVFLEVYGEGVDLESLRSSLIYSGLNNFHPDFSYNKNLLKFNSDILSNMSKFNKNLRYFQQRPKDPDYYVNSMWDLYNSNESVSIFDEHYENENEEMDELLDSYGYDLINFDQFSLANQKLDLVTIFGVDDVYQRAKNVALENFNKEYNLHIKPQIYKKYGIKLR